METPKYTSLVATIQQVNREVEERGMNSKTKASKSLLKVRNSIEGSFIQVSTLKDVAGSKFNVKEIKTIRTPFLSKGMMTIEFRTITLMIRDADVEELQKFISCLEAALQKSSEEKPALSHNNETDLAALNGTESKDQIRDTTSKSPIKKTKQIPVESIKVPMKQSTLQFKTLTVEQKREIDMRRHISGVKRSRSPVPSKIEKSAVKRRLTDNQKSVKITTKLQYLEGISHGVRLLTIMGINLKKIDERVLQLAHLSSLDLSENNIKNVDCLRNLNSTLEVLKLASNQLKCLDSRLAFAWRNVTFLDLKYNLLEMLPESFAYLKNLNHLDVSHNQLTCLPYNIRCMEKIRTLLVNDNEMRFVPGTLNSFQFPGTLMLNRIDLSNNSRHLIFPVLEKNCPGFGSPLGTCPSLLELCGEAILNLNSENASPQRYFQELPHSLIEYLDRGKICYNCRKMRLRYNYFNTLIPGRFLGTEVIRDGPSVNVKMAVCSDPFICDLNKARNKK